MNAKQFTKSVMKSGLTNRVGQELCAILAIVFGFVIEFHHIVFSSWKQFFFNNSDVLTLPLVGQSIALHEPFHWVFSSQIFLFPEGLLYAISRLFTPNFQDALVLNALINCLALYGLWRLLVHQVIRNVSVERLFSVVATLFLLLVALLEVREKAQIATYFLATTIYYGVILASLAALALQIRYLDKPTSGKGLFGRRYLLASLFGLAFLVCVSNPLYLLQFVIPLVIVAAIGLLVNLLPPKETSVLIATQLVACGLALEVRKHFLQAYFSKLGGLGDYLHFNQIGETFRTYKFLLLQLLQGGWQQKLQVFLTFFNLLAALILFIIWLHAGTKRKPGKVWRAVASPGAFIAVGLAGVAPILAMTGTILTGNSQTRYLIPAIVFPLFAWIPLLRLAWFDSQKVKALASKVVLGLAAALLLGLPLATPLKSVSSVHNYYTGDERCLDVSLANQAYSAGVAQYWRARVLQLYSKHHLKVIQVMGNLDKFTWLYNSADYQIYHPSFVIVDKSPAPFPEQELSLAPNFAILPDRTQNLLGSPSGIYNCPSFYIYLYPPDSPGYTKLNAMIRDPNTGL